MTLDSEIFKALTALAAGLFGILWTRMWKRIDRTDENVDLLQKKVGEMDVLVAGKYVTRDELAQSMQTLHKWLGRIEDKLDRKADR